MKIRQAKKIVKRVAKLARPVEPGHDDMLSSILASLKGMTTYKKNTIAKAFRLAY